MTGIISSAGRHIPKVEIGNNAAPVDARAGRDTEAGDGAQTMRPRLMAAFLDHARSRLGVAAETSATSVVTDFLVRYAGLNASARWLENDSELMLQLARASGLFAGDPEARDLTTGQKRLLAGELVLALTEAVDWQKALGRDPADESAVFYDGVTLRNACNLSVREAAAAIDARIKRALLAEPACQGLGALASALRRYLIGDPTLSFEPLPEAIRYGKREWASLWTDSVASAAAGLDPEAQSADELAALGRAAAPAQEATQAGGERDAQRSAPAQFIILLMAHAAGRVDLREITAENHAEAAKKIQAFAAEEFKSEIELDETMARLRELQTAPTAEDIAEKELRERGLDPMAVVIEEPISSKGKRVTYKLREFYTKFNDLSEMEANRVNKKIIEKAENFPLFNDVYNKHFNLYISDYVDGYKKVFRIVTDIAKEDGFNSDSESAFVSLYQISLKPHDDVRAGGFVVDCNDDSYSYSYYVSLNGIVERIPSGVTLEDWLERNRDLVFASEDLKKIDAGQAKGDEPAFLLKQLLIARYAQLYSTVDVYFRKPLSELKESLRPRYDGRSNTDRLLDIVVPFYSLKYNIRTKNYLGAYLTVAFGLTSAIPPMAAAGRLVGVSSKALFAGVETAVGSFARLGIQTGIKIGVRRAASFSSRIGLEAFATAGAVVDAISPVPAGHRSFAEIFAHSFRRLDEVGLSNAAARLREAFPRAAAELRAKLTSMRNRAGRPWTLSTIPRATPTVPTGAAGPHFVKVLAGDGSAQWLGRYGSAYVALDPHSLEPIGAILLPDDAGRLRPSLDVTDLMRHAVTDAAVLDNLRRTAVGDNGAIVLGDNTFARIADAYVEIAPEAVGAGEPAAWRVLAAGGHGVGPTTRLVYEPHVGGWVDRAELRSETEKLGELLRRWLANSPRAQDAAAPALLPTEVQIHAGRVYGDAYLDHVASNGPAIIDRLSAATTPDAMAIALLGEGRFLHAMLSAREAGAEELLRALAVLRPRALAETWQTAVAAEARAADLDGYVSHIMAELDADRLRELGDKFAAANGRAAALLDHTRSGNLAQQRRAQDLGDMVQALRRNLDARPERPEGGEAAAPATSSTTAELTAGERQVLSAFGLDPKPIGQGLLDELASALQAADAAFERAIAPQQALAGMLDVDVPAQAATRDVLLGPDKFTSAEFSRARLGGIKADDSNLVFPFANGLELTFSNRAGGNGEFRGTALREAAETLDFTSIADLVRRGDAARLETAKEAVLGEIGRHLMKLAPANVEELRLLYRALLMDERLLVNGRSFAVLAGRYAIDADDVVRYVYGGVAAYRAAATVPLEGAGAAAIRAYRRGKPRDIALLPGEMPIFLQTNGSGRFITQGGDWFAVQWAASSNTWRIILAGKPTAPRIPVRYADGAWRVHADVGAPSGAPTTRRIIDWEAAQNADVELPPDIRSGRGTYYDRFGAAHVPQGRISQTETVARAQRILELTTDVTPRVPWNDKFSDYFNVLADDGKNPVIVVSNPLLRTIPGQVGFNQLALERTKDFFVGLNQSETFRGLVNRAISDGRLGPSNASRWTIRVVFPDAFPEGAATTRDGFTVDLQQQTISIPELSSPALTSRYYIAHNGQPVPMSARRVAVRSFVAMLTEEIDPRRDAWFREGALDPQSIAIHGMGERGVIDYLAERIMREIQSPMPALLSHLPFDRSQFEPTSLTAAPGGAGDALVTHRWVRQLQQAIDMAGGIAAQKRFVDLQDRYLEAAFPGSHIGFVPTPSRPPSMADTVVPSLATSTTGTPDPSRAPSATGQSDTPRASSTTGTPDPSRASSAIGQLDPSRPPSTIENPGEQRVSSAVARSAPVVPEQGDAPWPPRVGRRLPEEMADLRAANVPVPEPYARSITDGQPAIVSNSETVRQTREILEQYVDLAGEEKSIAFSDYFTVVLSSPTGIAETVAPQASLEAFYNDLYRGSETFRQLVHRAEALNYIGNAAERKWTIEIVRPQQAAGELGNFARNDFAVDFVSRSISIPSPSEMRVAGQFYWSTDGNLILRRTDRIALRNFVRVFTRGNDPDLMRWGPVGRPDPEQIRTVGLGERGAIEYLTDFILNEAGRPVDRHLSSLRFDDRAHATSAAMAQAIDDAGGLARLQGYVEAQERFLRIRYWGDTPAAVPPRDPDAPPNPTVKTEPVEDMGDRAARPVQRVIDRQADERADIAVPYDIMYFAGGSRTHLWVSQTPTVASAMRMLDQAGDLAHDQTWSTKFDLRFDIVVDVSDSHVAQLDDASIQKMKDLTTRRTREAFLSLYRGSETFRSLANRAIRAGGRLANHRWTIEVGWPRRFRGVLAMYHSTVHQPSLAVNSTRRIVRIPAVDSAEFASGEYYLSTGGRMFAVQTRRVIVHNLVAMLTLARVPRLEPLLRQGLPADLSQLTAQLLGERGGIGYVVDRIIREMGLRESGWKLPPRISAVPFDRTHVTFQTLPNNGGEDVTRGRLNDYARSFIDAVADLDDLDVLWRIQNDYLDVRYPPMAAPALTPVVVIADNPRPDAPPVPSTSRRRPADSSPDASVPERQPRRDPDDRP